MQSEGWARRAVDVVGAASALVVLSPVFGAIALAVVLDSGLPVFFSQERVGKGRRPFAILKFRTMVVDPDRVAPKVSVRRDPRITRVGAILRATKLDEFPQIVNVLRGEMTIIGPRAEVPDMIRHYMPEELQILEFRPGLTAPGQIYFTTDQAAALEFERATEEEPGISDPELGKQLELFLAGLILRVGREILQEAASRADREEISVVMVPFDQIARGRWDFVVASLEFIVERLWRGLCLGRRRRGRLRPSRLGCRRLLRHRFSRRHDENNKHRQCDDVSDSLQHGPSSSNAIRVNTC
jgi:lipopolysaccharide/colanic/teichoic acid biosynthesis glycosyltransferase